MKLQLSANLLVCFRPAFERAEDVLMSFAHSDIAASFVEDQLKTSISYRHFSPPVF